MEDSKEFAVSCDETDSNEASQPWTPQKKELLVLLILTVVSVMVALDATVLVTILPDISQKLGGSTSQTFWAGTSYLLTSAVSQPVIAMLSEFLGSYILTATALVLFAAGSITCAIASSFSVLLTGRFIQGVGGGGIIALVQIICAEMIPLRHRPRWFSIILLSWAIGTIAGPFLGSGFVEVSSFRWVFWINVPVCCLGVIILLVGATQLDGGAVTMEGLSRVDWVGCCLFILSTSGFLVGISWGGIQFKWNSYQTLVPIICSTCGLLSLVVWERKYAPFPFIRPSLFQSKSLCAAYLGAFLHGLILYCVLYYVPFYFAAVHLKSPMLSAVSILPISCSMLPISAITSAILSRRGSFQRAIWIGWFFTMIGAGHLPLLNEATSVTGSAIIFVVFGLGTGVTLCAINFGIQTLVYQQDAGKAASMYTCVRSIGMSIGVAVGGNVFQNVMASSLRRGGSLATIAWNAESFVFKLKEMDENGSDRIKITHAYVQAFCAVFWVVAAISGIGFLTSLVIRTCKMEKAARICEKDS